MVKFLHTSDWQLGMTRHFLSDEAQARFSGARIEAMRTIGRVAESHGCEFVVVAGDVFESNQLDRGVVLRALDAMRSCRVPFLLLPGNHDPLDPGSIYLSPMFVEHKPSNVTVLRGESVTVAGVEIASAPWRSKRPLEDLVATAIGRLDAPRTNRILVGHGSVDTVAGSFDDPAMIRCGAMEQALSEGLVQYVALGDRHSLTPVGSVGSVYYSGTPEPTDYDETDPGWVLVVDLNGTGATVEPVRTGTWHFARNNFHLNNAADMNTVREWLNELKEKERTIVKLRFVGSITLAQKADLDAMLDHAKQIFGAVDDWGSATSLAVLPADDEFDELRLTGFAAATITELRSQAQGDGPEASAAGDALALLYRLAGGVA